MPWDLADDLVRLRIVGCYWFAVVGGKYGEARDVLMPQLGERVRIIHLAKQRGQIYMFRDAEFQPFENQHAIFQKGAVKIAGLAAGEVVHIRAADESTDRGRDSLNDERHGLSHRRFENLAALRVVFETPETVIAFDRGAVH